MRTTLPRLVCGSNSDARLSIGPQPLGRRFGMPSLLVFCALIVRATGSEVQVLVKDHAGRPIEGAIVWAEVSREKTPPPVQTEIVQKDRQFLPPVTVVPVGSVVRFPNRDNVQHHVYSFSAAKTFDIPLYIGESPQVIEFERPGIVTLGCNIHDWMAAYIVVLDTAVFAKTDARGIVFLRNLPAGPVSVYGDVQAGQTSVELTMKLRPAFQRTPRDDRGGGYR
jgi:plastocyanin